MRRTLFDDEHDLFRDSVRRFIASEAAPQNERWEQAGIVDRALFTAAGAHGFLGMAVPERYGGGGVDDFRYNLVVAEEASVATLDAEDGPAARDGGERGGADDRVETRGITAAG